MLPQARLQAQTVVVWQVLIDQQRVGCRCVGGGLLGLAGGLESANLAAPAFEHGSQRVEGGGFVVHAPDLGSGQWPFADAADGAPSGRWCRGTGRYRHRKHAAATRPGAQADRMPQQVGDAIHDRQAQTGAACAQLVGGRQAPEFLIDLALLLRGDAQPAVPDLDTDLIATATTAQQHAAAFGVADRVADEVLQDAAQQGFIGPQAAVGDRHAQAQST